MEQPILILIHLRGGVDALNVLIPYKEDTYYRERATIAIPRPNSPGAAALDLDGFWGAHPALEPLLGLYEKQTLAFVQAVGWPGDSHSHFEAWDEIESGVAGGTLPTTGWLARLMQARAASSKPLRAVAFGDALPRVLLGMLGVGSLRSLGDFRLRTEPGSRMPAALSHVFQASRTEFGQFGKQTLDALETVADLAAQNDFNRTAYPKTEFGAHLFAIEQLIRANVGLEAATLDLSNWDTHFTQGSTSGALARLVGELAVGIATFWSRLEDQAHRIRLLAMSEFGRRVAENGSGGTDHGQGGMMLVCGAGVRGGRVYGEWPGLAPERLVGPGDVRITTDYRTVLGEIAGRLVENRYLGGIFPGYSTGTALGLTVV